MKKTNKIIGNEQPLHTFLKKRKKILYGSKTTEIIQYIHKAYIENIPKRRDSYEV